MGVWEVVHGVAFLTGRDTDTGVGTQGSEGRTRELRVLSVELDVYLSKKGVPPIKGIDGRTVTSYYQFSVFEGSV